MFTFNYFIFFSSLFLLRTKKKKDQRERSRERSSRDKESKSSKKKHKEARSGGDKEERVASSSASASGSSSKVENARVTRDYDEEEKGYISGEGKPEKVYGAAAPPSVDATPPGSGAMEDNLESAVPSSMGDQMTSDTNLQQMDMDMSD